LPTLSANPLPIRSRFAALLGGAGLLCAPVLLSSAALAQTIAPLPPTVGSSNPVSAEPLVTRPTTKPCIVPIFNNQLFDDFNNKDFTYTPPADCKGPWSKVVLSANFNVSDGRQFDRTAQFFIDGVNFYFGTTAEPRSTLSPSWHFERDITDLSAVLKSTQPIVIALGNYYGVDGGVDYNGSISGSAQLEFYPANFGNPAPKEPDAVLPLDPVGETTALNTTTDRLTGTFPSLPRNIEGAYLQLFSQSQSADEFWYTCSPTSVATQLENCGNSGFRETEVYVDGKAAGIAPVYPWIYTGGIDPYLWEPITGVQTLNFKPYMVDLTPFAGVLSNGQSHTVSIGVYNADSYFAVTGSLLLYLDHGAKQVTGAVTENTLDQGPTPTIVAPAPVTSAAGVTSESASVTSMRHFVLSGYINTSHGRVSTTIDESVNFGNAQTIALSDSIYNQSITQLSGASTVTRQQIGPLVTTVEKSLSYPFTFSYAFTQNADGSYSQSSKSNQQDKESETHTLFGFPIYTSSAQEQVQSSDAYAVSAADTLTSQTSTSTGSYKSNDSLGGCYSETLTSADLKLTGVTNDKDCKHSGFPW
jgi:hypothetical protein